MLKINTKKVLRKFFNFFFKIKNKYLRLKLKFFKLLNKKFVKSTYGIYLKANYDDVTFKLCVLGCYGDFYFKRLNSINQEFVFIDIGANQGLFSIIASKNSKNVKCYSFEPVPNTFSFLKENIRFNHSENKCFPINKAISNRVGENKIFITKNHSGAATLASQNVLYGNSDFSLEIASIDAGEINKIVNAENYPIYVKIDVEGFEKTVIEELIKCNFFENIQEIFFEVDSKWVYVETIKGILSKQGFKLFKKIGTGNHFDILASK